MALGGLGTAFGCTQVAWGKPRDFALGRILLTGPEVAATPYDEYRQY